MEFSKYVFDFEEVQEPGYFFKSLCFVYFDQN